MPSGRHVAAGIQNRIRRSGMTLTVHYPPVRPVVTGTAPSLVPPRNPLSGTRTAPGAIQTAEVPSRAPVTIKCLWLPLRSATAQTKGGMEEIARDPVGWVEGAECLARVLVAEAALDVTDPYGDTVFKKCEVVEYAGHRYRVLAVRPVAASFRTPDTYYVWVSGAVAQ